MSFVDNMLDWVANKVQSCTGEKDRKELVNQIKDKYKESKWIDSIFYQVIKSKKYNLKKVDNVIVTKSEMEIIQSVKGKSRQKVLFTLLILAKYYNAVSDKNLVDNVVNGIHQTAGNRRK